MVLLLFTVYVFLSTLTEYTLSIRTCLEGGESDLCQKKTLAIVYSYRPDFFQVEYEDAGIDRGLTEEGMFDGVNVDVHRYYMNSIIENDTPEKRKIAGDKIKREIESLETPPDVMICCDDYAFEEFGLKFDNRTYPLVFNGVSRDLEVANETYHFFDSFDRPGGNVSGIYEKIYVFQSVRMLSFVFPSLMGKKFVVFFDNTSSVQLYYQTHFHEYEDNCLEYLNITLEVRFVKTMQELETGVDEVLGDPEVGGIGSLTWGLYDEFQPGVIHTSEEILEYVIGKVKHILPTAAFQLGQARTGYLGGIATDTKIMGEYTGIYAGRVLNGEYVGDLPIIDSQRACCFNKDRFEDLQVPHPEDIFQYASYVFESEDPVDPNFYEGTINYYYLFFLFFLVVGMVPIICFISCLICCICSVCCVSACLTCYAVRLRTFKRKFNKIDVDELLVELAHKESSGSGSGSGSGKNSSGDRPRVGLGNLKIRREMFLIPYHQIKLHDVLGRGGQSIVFKAKWKSKTVAYKNFSNLMSTNIEDFQNETSILACIGGHPNVLKFYGAVLEENRKNRRRIRAGIVTEYCSGGDLHDYILHRELLEESLVMEEKLPFLVMIAEGMDFLHDKHLIHRDLKLNNILLNKRNVVKIIDFGLSRYSTHNSSIKTKRVGTKSYLAPEIHGGKYTNKVDVFSYAIIMWNLLTNRVIPSRKVYNEDSDLWVEEQEYNDVKVAMDPNYRPYVPKPEEMEYSSGWFISLMERCWNHDPAYRPSFREIIEIINMNVTLERKKSGNLVVVINDENEEKKKKKIKGMTRKMNGTKFSSLENDDDEEEEEEIGGMDRTEVVVGEEKEEEGIMEYDEEETESNVDYVKFENEKKN